MTGTPQTASSRPRIGIIGLGSMGGMLLRRFLESGALPIGDCLVTTRSPEKRAALAAAHQGLLICDSNMAVATAADVLFVCVKPMEMAGVLAEISGSLQPGCHLVSIAACLPLELLEARFPGSISRLIPSLASELGPGVALVCHNSKVSPSQRQHFEVLVSALGLIKEIPESEFEIASDLTSCSPGLIAAIFQEFVSAALPHSHFSRAEAAAMLRTTLHGTARLMDEQNLDFDATIQRVATKGGITEAGVLSLRQGLPAVFEAMYAATLTRHADRSQAVRASFKAP